MALTLSTLLASDKHTGLPAGEAECLFSAKTVGHLKYRKPNTCLFLPHMSVHRICPSAACFSPVTFPYSAGFPTLDLGRGGTTCANSAPGRWRTARDGARCTAGHKEVSVRVSTNGLLKKSNQCGRIYTIWILQHIQLYISYPSSSTTQTFFSKGVS